MTRYDIKLSGCDDSTLMADVDLTADEHALIVRLSVLSEAISASGCEPRMRVVASPSAPDSDLCTECWEGFGNLTPELPVRDRRGEWVHFACIVNGPGAAQ